MSKPVSDGAGASGTPSGVERREHVAGADGPCLAVLEREAAHLTRRDHKRRLVIELPDGPAIIEAESAESFERFRILSTIR